MLCGEPSGRLPDPHKGGLGAACLAPYRYLSAFLSTPVFHLCAHTDNVFITIRKNFFPAYRYFLPGLWTWFDFLPCSPAVCAYLCRPGRQCAYFRQLRAVSTSRTAVPWSLLDLYAPKVSLLPAKCLVCHGVPSHRFAAGCLAAS